MINIKTGGSAFPVPNDANVNDQEGMTLRDYFAAAALTGFCSDDSWNPDDYDHRVARLCYSMADEMLKARGE